MSGKRSTFSGKLGFVLTAAGSAVGLGNICRFPYLAARYGGGMFLLVYLVLAVTFGFALMTMEIAVGRRTGLSAVGAYRALNEKYAALGYLVMLVPYFIFPYYCVVGGWVTKYFVESLRGGVTALASDSFFGGFVSDTAQPLLWFGIFLGVTTLVVMLGVEKGIELASKWLMPLLVVLSVVIAVYVACLPGAAAGVVYYLKPDFSRFSVSTVLAAMGQLFYSLSLSMGTMITFGSYMKDDISIHSSVRQIEWFDTGTAFLSGLMVVPAVFVVSGLDGLEAGSGLMFVTLPQVFARMAGGNVLCETDPETGIEVHTYGSHIFHTHLDDVWGFVRRFIDFNGYQHKVLARYKDRTYFLPLGLTLVNKLFGVELTPSELPAFMADETH